jgi:hypothetical protein
MLKVATLTAIMFNLGILIYFAAIATVWDEESHTFYLSRLPLSNLLDLMFHNFDQDAPAFNVLLHVWQKVVYQNHFLLRLMPLIFWVATMAGVGFLANRLAGRTAMFWALIMTSLWPYHWIYPISMRWYSLAAALGVWNLYFFVRLMESRRPNVNIKPYFPLLFGALVAVTGAALWYTVYIAPAIAAGELVLLLVVADSSMREGRAWAVAWLGAVILYLPWLPTFLGQLRETAGYRLTFDHIASSSYVVWAGDFSLPTTFWISLPFLAAFIVSLLLALKHWSMSRTPLLVGGVVFFSLLLVDAIEIERLLLVTVFLSTGIGISVAAALKDRDRRMIRNVVIVAGILALVGFGGSFANITSTSGWFTYRWLDDVEQAADHVESNYPGTLILSNSNSLAFYVDDPTGLELARYRFDNNLALASETKVWNTLLRSDADYGLLMKQAISSHADVTYVHHAFFNASGSSQQIESVLTWLSALGFEPIDRWQSTPIKGGNERFLNLQDHPSYRITLVNLRNSR